MAEASKKEQPKQEPTHLQIANIILDVQDRVNVATTGLPGDPFLPHRNARANMLPHTAQAREVMTRTFEMELAVINENRRRQGQPPLINITALNAATRDVFVDQIIVAVKDASKAKKFSEGTEAAETVAVPAPRTTQFRVGQEVRFATGVDLDAIGIPWRVYDQIGEVEAVHADEIEVYYEDEGESYYIRPRNLRLA